MTRRPVAILWAGVGVLAAVNGVVYVQWREAPPASGSVGVSSASRAADPWERWRTLDTSERMAYVQAHQALGQTEGASVALRQARQFAQMPPQRQQALRDLHAALQDVLQRQGPAGRRHFLRSTPQARAFFAYQALAATDPERLAQLAAQLGSHP